MTKFLARTTRLSLFVSRDGDLRYEKRNAFKKGRSQNQSYIWLRLFVIMQSKPKTLD